MIESLFESLNYGLASTPFWALLAAALWGVASMLLSPCHLASIPLIVGFIHGQGGVSNTRAMKLAALFAIGVLITIVIIGVITVALGRIAGDLGPWGYYITAIVFLVVGLYLLDILPSPWSAPSSVPMRQKGMLAALMLGLVFGIALGPCTFAYMAPVLSIAFGVADDSPLFAVSLLLAYGLGHCSIIVVAGSATSLVQRYMDWTGSNPNVQRFRQGCGVLLIAFGLYLFWDAL